MPLKYKKQELMVTFNGFVNINCQSMRFNGSFMAIFCNSAA